ncbi:MULTISPECIES: phosphoribosyltransferase [Myxococcus]|uniref:Phosphoribosyl transferase n=1 Tax=Myxococcus xanthus TaxID=34 RepID=A0AAE6G7E1_MYXXA|nr:MULTISPECIES: phosphoribosyltransferase family protein [Myxococcus]QDE71939.1 phosphoribosyl transferase [Myxococcus xanthus]QDE79221.1 phosphoribosyl transferase [Myxococcus xanthus]QDE86600.1 phosphoribosyl transferase [Myxococcus xanthus]QDF00758.1 phosphoribosyl transferase [Myxococcus xanthus]WAM26206.1 phosphoribosyltransferase family protein [Myxococcus sp. NMCA1]
MRFRDRADAGRRLAARLLPYRGGEVRVLGLARGGLRVAYEVAHAMEAPLDVWVSRRIDVPGRMTVLGAVSEGGGIYLDQDALRGLGLPEVEARSLARAEASEVDNQVQRLRGTSEPSMSGSTVLLVDDGLVSGATAMAALQVLRRQHPARLVLGVPVGTPHGLARVRPEADAVHCVEVLPAMRDVSEAYDDFRPLPDVELRQLLVRAREPVQPREVLESTDLGGFWM